MDKTKEIIFVIAVVWFAVFGLTLVIYSQEGPVGVTFTDCTFAGPNEPNIPLMLEADDVTGDILWIIGDTNQPTASITLSNKDIKAERYDDMIVEVEDERVTINYDPNTKILSSSQIPEETLKLIYLAFDICYDANMFAPELNEPINVVFAEPHEVKE